MIERPRRRTTENPIVTSLRKERAEITARLLIAQLDVEREDIARLEAERDVIDEKLSAAEKESAA